MNKHTAIGSRSAYLNLDIQGALLVVKFIIFIWVHLQVVEGEFFLDPLLGRQTLLEGKGIGLGNHGDDVDDIRQLLENDNVNGLKTVETINNQCYSPLVNRPNSGITQV